MSFYETSEHCIVGDKFYCQCREANPTKGFIEITLKHSSIVQIKKVTKEDKETLKRLLHSFKPENIHTEKEDGLKADYIRCVNCDEKTTKIIRKGKKIRLKHITSGDKGWTFDIKRNRERPLFGFIDEITNTNEHVKINELINVILEQS